MTLAIEPKYHEEFDISIIDPSPHQNRIFPKGWEKQKKTLELIESIKNIGVQQPLVARPHPKKDGRAMLVCGERRLRASRLAGKTTIPVRIQELDDETAASITIAENNQREDLSCLEEAQGVKTLMEIHKGDVQAVSAKIGRPVAWVRMRAKLDDLSPAWRKALTGGKLKFDFWTAAHFERIARFPQDIQDQILEEWTHRYYWRGENWSTKDLDQELGEYLHLLRLALWKLDDDTLCPNRGNCEVCTKRSDRGTQAGLFDAEEEEAVAPEKKARCLDKKCWSEKTKAFLLRKQKELAAEHKNLVYIATKSIPYHEEDEYKKQYGNVIDDSWRFDAAKKSDKASVPALVVYGSGVGRLRWIKLKSMGGATKSTVDPETGKKKPTPLKERRDRLDAKRWSQVLIELREKIEELDAKNLTTANLVAAVLSLAYQFGTDNRENTIGYGSRRKKPWATFWEEMEAGKSETDLATRLWEEIKVVLRQRLIYNGPITLVTKVYIDDARNVSKLLGIDVDAMFADVSGRKGFTEPKGWANMKEDGTPRTAPQSSKPKAKSSKSTPRTTKKTMKKAASKKAKKGAK